MEDKGAEKMPASRKVLDPSAEGTPIESVGSFLSISNGLGFNSEQELINYIEKQVVLDVGSGVGGLARESALRKIPTTIISMNPRFSLPGHLKMADEFYSDENTVEEYLAPLLNQSISASDIEEAAQAHRKHAVAGFSHVLPIKDAVVNKIIDHKGAIYHMLCEDIYTDFGLETRINVDQERLEKTLNEYMRVLVPGGKARLGGIPTEAIFEQLKNILNDMNMKYEVFKIQDYRVTDDEEEENKYQYAVECSK